MGFKDRKAVIEFVEHTYFGNVGKERIDDVLDCFHHDAEVIIRHGDNPVRYFSIHPRDRHDDLKSFYTHLCGNYVVQFTDFKHFVDLDADRSACYFNVQLTPKPGALYAGSAVQGLNNSNFFRFDDGKIAHMLIYYTNSGAETIDSTPTGYPK